MNSVMVPTGVLTREQRQGVIYQIVAFEVATGGRVVFANDRQVVVRRGGRVNHVLHLLLTVFTFFVWAPVWVALAWGMKEVETVITVDDWGRAYALTGPGFRL